MSMTHIFCHFWVTQIKKSEDLARTLIMWNVVIQTAALNCDLFECNLCTEWILIHFPFVIIGLCKFNRFLTCCWFALCTSWELALMAIWNLRRLACTTTSLAFLSDMSRFVPWHIYPHSLTPELFHITFILTWYFAALFIWFRQRRREENLIHTHTHTHEIKR